VAIELLIQDGSPDWWESPDIWVVPGTDPNGAAGTPLVGKPAYLWATVSNERDIAASQVQVDFWVADPSLQIRKSTANHIGTAFADVPAGSSQDVLCLVPWNVALVNGGHECVIVEASDAADPLAPPPADADVLDAPTYRQIAQRNLSVAVVSGSSAREIVIAVHAGARAEKAVEVELTEGRPLSKGVLASLGVKGERYVEPEHLSVALSHQPMGGREKPEGGKALSLEVSRGTSGAAYLSVAARRPLEADEYSVVRVVERDARRVIGGLSVVVQAEQPTGGDR
jgi:hypothetical protein